LALNPPPRAGAESHPPLFPTKPCYPILYQDHPARELLSTYFSPLLFGLLRKLIVPLCSPNTKLGPRGLLLFAPKPPQAPCEPFRLWASDELGTIPDTHPPSGTYKSPIPRANFLRPPFFPSSPFFERVFLCQDFPLPANSIVVRFVCAAAGQGDRIPIFFSLLRTFSRNRSIQPTHLLRVPCG